ncbi:hypothetical protein SeLEV6574_g03732 [Synchytrium endobioticum]|uniref:Uncharacterized protein n=1 Tax=Synchytrium endobioticum TaxID=286115 RepID=A0A507D303_9FUNG|nr:hypothetical protein SeLEV6574_g03732 [Synchytrium endobioticum]
MVTSRKDVPNIPDAPRSNNNDLLAVVNDSDKADQIPKTSTGSCTPVGSEQLDKASSEASAHPEMGSGEFKSANPTLLQPELARLDRNPNVEVEAIDAPGEENRDEEEGLRPARNFQLMDINVITRKTTGGKSNFPPQASQRNSPEEPEVVVLDSADMNHSSSRSINDGPVSSRTRAGGVHVVSTSGLNKGVTMPLKMGDTVMTTVTTPLKDGAMKKSKLGGTWDANR